MITQIRRPLGIVAALVLMTSSLAAAPDAKSSELLEATVKAIQGGDTHQVVIRIVSQGSVPTPQGKREIERRITFDMASAKPNQFRRLTSMGEELVEARVSDGKQLTSFLGDLQIYEVVPAPATHAELISRDPVAQLSIVPAMLGAQTADQLSQMGENQVYAGLVTTEGITSHRINFTTEEGAAYFLLSNTTPPVLDRIVMGDGADVTTTYSFAWGKGAPETSSFTFAAPESAKKVDSIQGEIQKLQQSEPDAKVLQGRPAPPIKLTNIRGEAVDISSHMGKQVVVLDFWATWCGPCRKALPIIDALGKEYKDKDVAVYTVNLEDPPEAVTEFLTANKLDVQVLMDKDGAIGRAYMAASIPQTVIIDKTGVVSNVHIGLSPDLDQELRAEIDKLLAATKVE